MALVPEVYFQKYFDFDASVLTFFPGVGFFHSFLRVFYTGDDKPTIYWNAYQEKR